ncbi:MAG: DNA polymerase III subunit beta [bacterium]|nr:DNA polymerase III subunit beta [bacterium]MDZ4299692.1 DNA polymerase III subunit beta [Candidatus Sungbacteria bacterium]
MKFTCLTTHLQRALGIAERFTGKNLTLPVLSSVLLDVSKNTLRVRATNLEHAVEITIAGTGAHEGRVVVPARVASQLIQSVGDARVDLEERHGSLLVCTRGRETKINGLNPEEFPLIPKVTPVAVATMDGAVLGRGIASVLPAVSLSEFKPELCGVLFHLASHEVRCAATDTFRLAEFRARYTGDAGKGMSFIIPQRIGQEMGRILTTSEEVTITMGDNQALFETVDVRVLSRLIEGTFPEYGGIIPKNFESSCYLKRTDLLSAVKAASIFSSKLQEVTLSFAKKSVSIAARNAEVGEYITEIPTVITGKERVVSFNYHYLLDGLNLLTEDECFFGINGEAAPGMIRNKADGSILYVMMPIRI